MPEEKKLTVTQEQAKIKPKPEDIAQDLLDEEKAAIFLNLVDFIRANKIGIRWASYCKWKCSFKGKKLGDISIYDGQYAAYQPYNGSWRFSHGRDFLDLYYSMEDCDLKTFVFDNIYVAGCGNGKCTNTSPDAQKAGYMNPTGCCYPLRIYNPSGETLEHTKQLILFRKNYILEITKTK